jgi:integrase/recombinase XerD
MSNTILLPFQPDSMTRAQLAAVSYLARYSGHTHSLYAYQLRRWFEWCETRLDPLDGIQRAHVELYIRHLGGCGLLPSYRALVPRLVQVEEVPDGSSNQGLDSATNMPRVR